VPPGNNPLCPNRGHYGVVPYDFSKRNIGDNNDQGFEHYLQQRIGSAWSWFFNASWQDDPEFVGVTEADQNKPPEWRANVGLSYDVGSFFVNGNANYQDEAFWADVLNVRAATDSFTQINLSLGVRLLDERMTLQVTGANVTDEDVQQHIFGDIISRKITGQLGFRF
jgi:hypothetical protein